MSSTKQPLMGSVLVTGGCGFLGYALVKQLLNDPECGSVYIVDRAVNRNLHDGAQYHQVDITDGTMMGRLFQETKPTVVFNLASPNFTYPTHGRGDFYATNVSGSELLLRLSADHASTKAFVHASSVDIYANPPHVNSPETQRVFTSPREDPYAYTKAIADSAVLAANSPHLRTVSLRCAHMYGPRCNQQLPALLDVAAGNGPLFRLGSGENKVSVVSSENAAAAHILAAKALLDPRRANGKLDGEAFNLTEGEPVLFWYHTSLHWSAARGHSVTDELITIPAWLARFIFGFIIWAYWILTFGYVSPPTVITTTGLTYSLDDHTYSPEKLRERLGFRPPTDHDEVIRQSVAEELRRRESLKSGKPS